MLTLKALYKVRRVIGCRALPLLNPFRVCSPLGYETQGALRDPGLRNITASRYDIRSVVRVSFHSSITNPNTPIGNAWGIPSLFHFVIRNSLLDILRFLPCRRISWPPMCKCVEEVTAASRYDRALACNPFSHGRGAFVALCFAVQTTQ
jgi:hypothetical protein